MLRRSENTTLRFGDVAPFTNGSYTPSRAPDVREQVPDLRRALRGAMVLVPAGTAIGIGNLAFGAVVGRIIGSAVYGAVGTLLVAGTIGSLAALGTLYEVARTTSQPRGSWGLTNRELYSLMQPWLIVSVAFTACAIPLEQFLHLASVTPVILAAALFLATVLSALPQGVLVGSQRFGWLAVVGVAITVVKIGLGAWFPRQFSEVTGALVAALVATATGCIAYLLGARMSVRKQRLLDGSDGRPAKALPSPKLALGGGMLATLLWCSLGIPLLFARHVLSPDTAGAFAVTQALASGVVFVAGPIATAFFPAVARNRHIRTALVGLIATVAIAALVTAGLVGLGPSIVRLAYGHQFVSERVVFATTGLSAALISCLGYCLWVSAALNRRRGVAIVILGSVAAEIVLALTWHSSAAIIGVEPGIGVVVGSLFGALLKVTVPDRAWGSQRVPR